jgi:hypothetical protein
MNKVDIANLALTYLGEAPINSLTQQTNSAKVCNDLIDPAVRFVLSEHNWNRPRRRAKLAKLAGAPEFGFDFKFQLPVDFIKVVDVNQRRYEWVIEDNTLHANIREDVELTYVAYPSDFSILNSQQVAAIASYLAFLGSIRITGNYADQERMNQLYEKHLGRAKTKDARETGPQEETLYEDTLRESPMIQRREEYRRYPGYYRHVP